MTRPEHGSAPSQLGSSRPDWTALHPPLTEAGDTRAGRRADHRPRLLVAVAAAVVIVLVIATAAVLIVQARRAGTNQHNGAGSLPSGSAPPVPSSGPTTVPESPAPSIDPVPAPTGSGAAEPGWSRSEAARQLWLPTATGFASRYTLASRPASATAWATALAPYGTVKVNEYLATRRLDQIPTKAAYDGTVEVLRYDTAQVAVQITYDDGYTLVLYIDLTQQPPAARVAAFDELEQ